MQKWKYLNKILENNHYNVFFFFNEEIQGFIL